MVNTQLLDSKISESGLKITYIVEQMGISRQAFDKKKKNVNRFRKAEMYVLGDLLNLSDQDKAAIFFAPEVGQ